MFTSILKVKLNNSYMQTCARTCQWWILWQGMIQMWKNWVHLDQSSRKKHRMGVTESKRGCVPSFHCIIHQTVLLYFPSKVHWMMWWGSQSINYVQGCRLLEICDKFKIEFWDTLILAGFILWNTSSSIHNFLKI